MSKPLLGIEGRNGKENNEDMETTKNKKWRVDQTWVPAVLQLLDHCSC